MQRYGLNRYLCAITTIQATMESVRQQKVAKQIQKEVGSLFQRTGPSIWGAGALVTVTKVAVTKDLQVARIHLSIFGASDKHEVLKRVREKGNEIRYQLGKDMRHQLRVIPVLEFFEDDSLDYIENIDRLLKS
jgi:ribosome-binding factor A